jgi:hypothetical protein
VGIQQVRVAVTVARLTFVRDPKSNVRRVAAALLDAYFMLVSCLTNSSVLKMEIHRRVA